MMTMGFGELWDVDDISIGVVSAAGDGDYEAWIWMDYQEGEPTTTSSYDADGHEHISRRPLEMNAETARKIAAQLMVAADDLDARARMSE